MTQPSHSPEPWAWHDSENTTGLGRIVHAGDGHPETREVCWFGDAERFYPTEGTEPSDADISRILVCINACKGIPNEILESVIEADKESGRSMIQEALELVVHMHVNKINRQALEAAGDA